MQTDDILCEAPGPDGMTCTLPYGHQPADRHAFEFELPPTIAKIVAEKINDYEEAHAHALKALKHARISLWMAIALIVLYFVLIVRVLVGG
jgi:hypothetical protein